MAYGDNLAFPALGQTVLYWLSGDEFIRYGLQSVSATITFVHTPTCVDLLATFTTKGPNPGQSVTLTPVNVGYGQTPRSFCEAGGYSGKIPGGSPW